LDAAVDDQIARDGTRHGGRWSQLIAVPGASASRGATPEELIYQGADDATGSCDDVTDVPAAVAADLGACTAPSSAGSGARVYVPRGTRLVIRPRRLDHGAHSLLTGLRWSGWGEASATAKGTLDYEDRTATFRAPVHVRVSRIATCGTRRAYLRRTITFDVPPTAAAGGVRSAGRPG
jgi:hypothetical protein